jgi:hypothetical protein
MTVPAVTSPMPSGGEGIARGNHTEQEKRNDSDRLFFHGSQRRKKRHLFSAQSAIEAIPESSDL